MIFTPFTAEIIKHPDMDASYIRIPFDLKRETGKDLWRYGGGGPYTSLNFFHFLLTRTLRHVSKMSVGG